MYIRDKYTCQHCGYCGAEINADHIKEFAKILKENNIKTLKEALLCKELWDLDNGRTLCVPCHKSRKQWDNQNNMRNKIKELLQNTDKIPEKYWEETDGGKYKVVWILDRQKPSVEADYSFDEERLGITDDGRLIWGFDSGCSCPSPWSAGDYGDDNYMTNNYKEFFIKLPDFDTGWEEESSSKIDEILKEIKK